MAGASLFDICVAAAGGVAESRCRAIARLPPSRAHELHATAALLLEARLGRYKSLTLPAYVRLRGGASCGLLLRRVRRPTGRDDPALPRFFAWQTKTATMRKRRSCDSATSSCKSLVPVSALRPPSPRQQALCGCVQA
jgi:hypothetical protein